MTAPTIPAAINRYIGTAVSSRPTSEKRHMGLRPTLSDSDPANGRKTIMQSIPISGTTSAPSALSPISVWRYVGM